MPPHANGGVGSDTARDMHSVDVEQGGKTPSAMAGIGHSKTHTGGPYANDHAGIVGIKATATEPRDNLPITANRNAKWYYVAFHNVTAMVGAGVLGLPAAMAYLGWVGGTIALVLSFVISLWTLYQLCALHEIDGKRMNRYHELGQYAFGPRLGLWIVVPFQVIVMVGLGITYTVTGGSSLHNFYRLVCDTDCVPFGLSAWILVFAGSQFIASQLPNFNSLSVISLLAAIMSIAYSTIGWAGSVNAGKQPDAAYNLSGYSRADGIMGAFSSLGTMAFAYGGHNVVLEIQATLPAKPGVPQSTLKPYMRGVYIAYGLVAYCYFTVAIAGYWAFGNKVASNVIFSIKHPVWMVAMADLFVVVHVFGSYQVYSMPIFDMLETLLVKRGIKNTGINRVILRSLYVCFTTFVAVSIPFFGDLLGFFGAFGFAPTTFWLPCVIWLIVKKPSKRSFDFWINVANIILCVSVMFLAAIGSLYGIINTASSYKFYQ